MGGGRAPCCDKKNVKRGPWSPAEDMKLAAFIQKNGHGNWRSLPKLAGLLRCGKSCRLRWINYLSPSVKRGNFTLQEEETIIKLHDLYGNRWSKIAAELPGRTDNEIKNVWNTHLKKRLSGKYSQCRSNISKNKLPKNDECSSIMIAALSSVSSTSATSNTGAEVPCQEDNKQPTRDHRRDQCPPVATMPEMLTEITPQICPDNNAKKETSRTSSFSSNASDYSSSAQPYHQAGNADKEMESLLSYSEEVPSDFDIWTVLEDFEKFESQQEQQLVPSYLQGSSSGDEDYIINHDIELAEKSEWYRYLENNEIGLVGIIGEEENISQNGKTGNGFCEEMSLEPEIDPDMDCLKHWPPSPHIF
ncbi:hypothetical protein DCAR_0417276 [Daucus carota subsp. sativus]|uniref:Uncharacterized protein n=1 Tax=Daucus carota subsp. sativus TaxID=79200 RepID=A0A162ACQ3_DAUCS|nr:PREDICTED: myb-related protein Myb4-like [Daucus carota subsp. sativus]WOG97935.1 hypothetical protein DCAR_0417276 [Daucus carota subsp. sativus]